MLSSFGDVVEYIEGVLQVCMGVLIVDRENIYIISEDNIIICSDVRDISLIFQKLGLLGHLPHVTNAAYYRNGEDNMYIPSDLDLLEESELNELLNFERDYDVD